ncbi:MAG: nucleoid-associated protein [Saprospiraceae bacterium]
MITFDTSNVQLKSLITHWVGNKQHEETVRLSDLESQIIEESMEYLLEYFISPFEPNGFHHFFHPVELSHNEVYKIAEGIFNGEKDFVKGSRDLATMLHEHTNHPKIKSGELNVVHFENLILGDEMVDGIGIFKSETNVPFIKMLAQEQQFTLGHQFGFELGGMDKGCLIFNTHPSDGYQVLVFDHTNRALDTKYWINDFLQLIPSSDEYYNTKEFLNLTKKYISHGIDETVPVSKTDKIDMLNKSVEYFKQNDTFEKEAFEDAVFENEDQKASFRNFQTEFLAEKRVELADTFGISEDAVKKQARVFKSVLKLDKNFSIYIHGDKSLIQRGVDVDGRKYYKLYFEEES